MTEMTHQEYRRLYDHVFNLWPTVQEMAAEIHLGDSALSRRRAKLELPDAYSDAILLRRAKATLKLLSADDLVEMREFWYTQIKPTMKG